MRSHYLFLERFGFVYLVKMANIITLCNSSFINTKNAQKLLQKQKKKLTLIFPMQSIEKVVILVYIFLDFDPLFDSKMQIKTIFGVMVCTHPL